MLAQEVPLVQSADPNLAVLGFLAVFFAGAFFLSSVGRDRPRQRIGNLLGSKTTSLSPLRAALQSKARTQAASFFLMVGSALLIAAFFFRLEVGRSFVYWAAGAMTVFSLVFLVLLEGYVAGAMRRYLAAHLRQHPFAFEDHLALTREIGELFKVRSHPEDTLESYVAKVRAALGLPLLPARTQSHRRTARMVD